MASKKNDEFNLDDFNFDEFNFGEDSIPGVTPAKKSRKPIEEVADSFMGSVKESFTDENFIRRMVSDSLPTGYGKAINTTYEGLGTLRELYDSGVREFQPADSALRAITSKMLPAARKILPKGLADRLDQYSKDSSQRTSAPTQGETDEKNISDSLGDIFKTQAAAEYKQRQYDEAKGQIRESIEDKQFRLGFNQTQSMRQGIQRLVAYQDQVTAQYQRKHIELQYRQYFALRDISETTKREAAISNDFLKAIAHNSALPDLVKTRFREVGKSLFEERLAGGMQNMVSTYIANFIPQIKSRILKTGKDVIGGARRGLTDTYDMAETARSMGMTGTGLAGGVAGGYAADEIGYQAARRIKDRVKNIEPIQKAGNWLDDKFSSVAERGNEWARSPTARTGVLGFLESVVKNMVGTYSPNLTVADSPLAKLDQATQFNNHTQKSITEVIPGYLSRIFREIQVLRTGDMSTPLTVYNLDRGEFTSDHQAKQDITRRLLHPTQVAAFRQSSDALTNTLDPQKKLTPKQRDLLARQNVLDAQNGIRLNAGRIMDPNYRINNASAEDHAAIVKHLRSHFNVAAGSNEPDYRDEDTSTKARAARTAFEEMRRRYPTPIDQMRVYSESGQAQLLRELGYTTKNGFEDRVDPDAMLRIILGESPGGSGTGGPGGGSGPSGGPGGRRGGPSAPRGRGPAKGKKAPKNAKQASVYARMSRNRGYSVSADLDQFPIPMDDEHHEEEGGAFSESLKKINAQAASLAALREQLASTQRKMDQAKAQRQTGTSEYELTARHAAEAHHQMNGGVGIDTLVKAVETNGKAILDAVTTGKLVEESEAQTDTQASIEKLVRALLKRTGGHTIDGDADFGDLDDDGIHGNSPEARLARQLHRLRRKAGAGARHVKEGFGKAAGWARKKASGLFSSGMFHGTSILTKGRGLLKEWGDRTLDAAEDLYEKGRNSPLLEYAKLKAGEYFDAAGKPLHKWSDIKGAVYDRSGRIIADAKQVSRGFYDLHGKRILQSVTSKVLAGAWKIASMWQPLAWARSIASIAGAGLNMVRNVVDGPMDVYVKGESNPRLKGVVMAGGGYYVLSGSSRKPVMRPSDITGVVRTTDGDQVVIDLDDIKKGLVNVFGFPVGSLGTIAKRLIVGAFTAAKERVVKAAQFVKKVGLGAWDIAKNTFHGAANILHHGIGGVVSSKDVAKQTDLLQRIYDLLDDRLPGKKHRVGFFGDEIKGEHAFGTNDHQKKEGKDNEGKSFFDMLKGLFSKKGKGGGNSYSVDLGKDAKEAEEAAKEAGKTGKVAGWIEKNVKGGKYVTKAGRAIGGVAKKGWGLAKKLDPTGVLSGAAMLAGKAKGLGGKLLSKTGNLASKGWQYGKNLFGKGGLGEAGELAEAGEAGTGLAEAGGAAAGAGELGLAGVGGAEALGAVAAGGAAEAAAGAGAGILAILGAPVLLTAAAIALVGYGAYKVYQHFKNKMGPLETYRMAQYGVDDASPDKYNKIRSLEQLLEPYVIYSGKTPSIDSKKIQLDAMLSIFGIKQTDKDKVNRFGTWFIKRFKPVFLTHMSVLHALAPRVKLENVDGDLDKKLKMKYLDSVGVDESIYRIGVSPFSQSSWLLWSKADGIHSQSEFVEEALGKARKALNSDGIKNETTAQRAAIGTVMGASDKAAQARQALLGNGVNPNLMAAMSKGPSMTPGARIALAAGAGGVVVSTLAAMTKSRDPSGLSALEATRMRAYGLVKLDVDKVRQLLSLEDEVINNTLDVKSDGSVSFKGKPTDIFAAFGSMFGVRDNDAEAKNDWFQWFNLRFLTVVMQYAASVKKANKSAMLSSPETMLKPSQMLSIANDMIGAKASIKGSKVAVWGLENSPWPGYLVNDDPKTTDGNVEALKQLVKTMLATEQTAQKTQALAAASPASTAAAKGASTTKTAPAFNLSNNSPSYLTMGKQASPNRQVPATGYQPASTATPGATGGAGYAANVQGGAVRGPSGGYAPSSASKKGAPVSFKPNTGASPGTGYKPAPINKSAAIDQLRATMAAQGINDPVAQANVLANIQAESNFTPRDESLKYSAQRLCSTFPSHFKSVAEAQACIDQGPEAVGNKIYGGRMGNAPDEGYAFRGRGYIQLTGKAEYEAMSKLIGVDLVKNPDAANDPATAAKIAVAYIKSRVKGGDLTNVNAVTAAVGPANLSQQQTKRAALAQAFLKPGAGGSPAGYKPNTGASPGTGDPTAATAVAFKPNSGASPGTPPAGAPPAAAPGGKAPMSMPTFTPDMGVASTAGGPSAAPSAPAMPAPTLTASTPMTPVSGTNDDQVQRLNTSQQSLSTMSDAMSRKSSDKISDSTAAMTDLLTKQLAVQTSMDSSLKTINTSITSLLSLTGKQLDAMGKMGQAGAAGGQANANTASAGNKTPDKMPGLPVDVSRAPAASLAG